MALIFVERRKHYSVYRRSDGTLEFLSHTSPPRFLVEFDSIDLSDEWEVFDGLQDDFRDHLRLILTEPEVADDVSWCDDCERILHEDGFSADQDRYVCEPCADENYRTCERCNHLSSETSTTLSDYIVCDRCISDAYSYCEGCEGYYRDVDASDHDHDALQGMNCCSSPELNFVVRNDGQPPLANDTRVKISLPADTIDAEGLTRIYNLLRGDSGGIYYAPWHVLEAVGAKWQTKEGNFTKRLSRAMYKRDKTKLTPALMSEIGNIASAHSRSVDFYIETTRELDMDPSDFFNDDSCWWGSYSASRCSLKSNGGFGLRSFDDIDEYAAVSGRAWVMPLKAHRRTDSEGVTIKPLLTPTFQTEHPDAFVVFNGYGDLEGYAAARIVSHMAGFTYRKISFACSPMYVNADTGYLVAPEEIATHYTDGELRLRGGQHSDLYHTETVTLAAVTVAEKELVDA